MARSDEAPYKQSRAALRRLYGTRSINASAPQSAQDMTPSGRVARAMAAGSTEAEAEQQVSEQFNRLFRRPYSSRPEDQPGYVPLGAGGPASAFTPSTPGGFASAAPTTPLTTVGGSPTMAVPRGTGRPSGWSATPIPSSAFPAAAPASFTPATPGPALTPLSYNLSDPSPVGATQLASMLPQTPLNSYVPPWRQQRQGGYMSSILNGASKYLT